MPFLPFLKNKNMKIKSKNSKIVSMKLCVPFDGIVQIDENGIVDVSPKCAVQLVTGTNDWEYLKKEENKNTIDSEEKSEASEESNDYSERELLQRALEKMSLDEMKNMAKEAGYNEKEWGKIATKKLMSAYLLKKFDSLD